jgi:membrane protein
MKKEKNTITKILPIYIVLQTYNNWRNDRTLRLGAGLAYYGVFAIVPIFTLMIGLAATFFSTQDINSFLNSALIKIFGTELAQSVNQVLTNITEQSTENTLSSVNIISFLALLISASFIFVAFQDALDTIWHHSIRIGWRKWFKKYLWAYLAVLIISSLLFGVLLINTVGKVAISIAPGEFLAVEALADFLISFSSWGLGIFVLALIFRLLIIKKISWRILILGSAITSLLVVAGTWLLGYYLSNYASGSLSGAVGAVLLLLIWIYYEAQIILIGAQFIKTLENNINRLPSILQK